MESIIQLNTRNGENNFLKKLTKPDGSDSKTYILKTEYKIIRVGYIENDSKFIDPPGGSILSTGMYLKEADATIKNIDFQDNLGYIITFV